VSANPTQETEPGQHDWLRVTLASIGDGVITTDTRGCVTFLNPVAQELTGWKSDEAAGIPLQDVFKIFNEETRRPVENPAERALRDGVVVGLANHTVLITRDGVERPIDDSAAPIRNARGDVAGVVLVFRDVTDRRTAEKALRESEERFRLMVEGVRDYAIFMLDPQGGVVTWNAGAERIKGYRAEEIVGTHFSRFYPVEALERGWPAEELRRAVADGRFEDEGWRVRKDGSRFWANVVITALRDADGSVRGFSKITRDLTEQKKAEESTRRLLEEQAARQAAEAVEQRMRASEERLRLFVEHTPAAVAVLDREMRYLLVSERRLRDYGLEGQDLIGRNYYEVFPDVPERWKEVHRRCLAGATERCEEDRFIRPDGQEVWLHWEICPWRDPQGEIGGIIIFSEVITDRRRAEEHLRSSEQLFRTLTDHAPVGIFQTDDAGNCLFVNDKWCALSGLTPNQAHGPGWTVALHPDDRERVFREWCAAAETGKDFSSEYRFRTPGGAVSWLQGSALALRDDAGTITGHIGTITDITDRKRAEDGRRAAEAQLYLVTDTMAAPVTRCDRDLTYRWVSKPYADWLGLPVDEIVGQPIRDVLGTDAFASLRPYFERVLSGQVVRYEEQVSYPGVGPRWIHAVYSPTFDSEGVPDGWVAVVLDIDDRKRAEEALKEADRLKDEYVAMLAHELRNPLAPIRNALHIMKQPGVGETTIHQVREMAERQVLHMARLLEDLLDVSRISRGRIDLRREAVDVTAVIARTVEAVRPLTQERRHEITITHPALPLRIDADPARLEQILTNLLNNAAKYTDPGGHIWLTAERKGTEVVLHVRDTGIGIAPGMLPKIFDLFVQAERRVDRAQGGVGIGLTLVKRLVEMHGGSVQALSAGLGRGSEFIVRLPAVAEAADGQEVGKSDAEEASAPPQRRILVVDDNRDAADSLALLLRLAGQDVRLAYDGPSALAEAREFRAELVFLDIGMPGMDGYEVAKRLRQQAGSEDAVLVAITGWGQSEDRRRAEDAGFDGHLVKPAKPETLRQYFDHQRLTRRPE
jgi:PAS domain S-box-containing protein